MANVKVSSQVERTVWAELRAMARESHQSVSGLLTEALREFLARRRVRPEVLERLADSLEENAELVERLAR
jgi:predicted DNA-binding ribbon-helix-helix protein